MAQHVCKACTKKTKALRHSARSRSLSQQTRICLELSTSALNGFCSGHCRSTCPEIDPSLPLAEDVQLPNPSRLGCPQLPNLSRLDLQQLPNPPGWILRNSPIPPGRINTPISPDWTNCCCSCTKVAQSDVQLLLLKSSKCSQLQGKGMCPATFKVTWPLTLTPCQK